MRGLVKAAALLSSHLTSAFVIPDATALEGRPSDPIVEYVPSEAQLKFVINEVEPAWGFPVLRFEVGTTERLCAESNVSLDGRQLESSWNGIQGSGQGSLQAYGSSSMSWTITCLWDSNPSDGSYPNLGDITHLLTLKVKEVDGRQTSPGFTISYRQFGIPSILRFEPHYTVPSSSNAAFPEWRSPKPPFAIEAAKAPAAPESKVDDKYEHEHPTPIMSSSTTNQKSLISGIKHVEEKIKETVHQAMECLRQKFCPWNTMGPIHYQGDSEDQVDSVHVHDELDFNPEPESASSDVEADEFIPASTPTTTAHHPSTTPTATTIPAIQNAGSHNSIPLAITIKAFLLSFALLLFLIWTFIRCRDPRRRAERAAQQEERRTKRLYARAARIQKFKSRVQLVRTVVWNVRVKYGLASAEALLEDEKQRRVSEQEKFLEDLVEGDIRAFRDTHRVVSALASSVGGAEEGRSGYVISHGHGYRRSRSMRSVSTLPEYDSEGSRPPSYRERVRRDSMNEFTSDSSVVSTSPRISRDGTNSDFEEKIEDISLDDARPGASRLGAR